VQAFATPARLNNLQADVNTAVAGRVDVTNLTVRQQTTRGVSYLLVEADFTGRGSGEAIMDTLVARMQTRQTVAPSYVWLKSTDDVARTQTERHAVAPGWTITDVVTQV
jgi:hypothetical protein